jgi:hypothetical protein
MAMYSPDGECLTFSSGLVVTEGQPEEWLNHVEKAMFDTTRKNLHTTLQDSEGGDRSAHICAILLALAVAHHCSAVALSLP